MNNGNFMILSSNRLLNILFCLSIFLLVLSNLFYIKLGSNSVSFFFIVSFPVLVFIFFIIKKIILFNSLFFLYFYFLFFIFLSFLGVLVGGSFSSLAQIYIFFLVPLIFLYFGLLIDERVICKNLLVLVSICFAFSIGQFIYFNFNINGPFGIFNFFTEILRQSQIDFSVELIGSRASGVFVNPNILGFFGGLVTIILLYLKNEKIQINLNLSIILGVMIVLISSSRTSIIGLLVCSIIIFLGKSIKKFNAFYVLKVFFTSFFGIFCLYHFLIKFSSDYYIERFNEIFLVISDGTSNSVNLDSRLNAWENLMYYIDKYPFGTILPPQLIVDYSPDNQFIYFWLQGGFFLLILFACLLVYLLQKSLKLQSVYFFAVVIFLITSSITLVAFNSFVIGIFWLFIGMILRKRYGVNI